MMRSPAAVFVASAVAVILTVLSGCSDGESEQPDATTGRDSDENGIEVDVDVAGLSDPETVARHMVDAIARQDAEAVIALMSPDERSLARDYFEDPYRFSQDGYTPFDRARINGCDISSTKYYLQETGPARVEVFADWEADCGLDVSDEPISGLTIGLERFNDEWFVWFVKTSRGTGVL